MVPPVPMNGYTKSGAVVLHQVESNHQQFAVWRVRCACGEEFERVGYDIRRKHILQCYKCFRRACGENSRTHGGSHSVNYSAWAGMRNRCFNPKANKYINYGERGISVYPKWAESFEAFEAYLMETIGDRPSKRHSLDRIDNDGDYAPGNIRWATAAQQVRNRRSHEEVRLHYEDVGRRRYFEFLGLPPP